MQSHEYRERDKTVKKKSRDGLTEQRLGSKETIRISLREKEGLVLTEQREEQQNFRFLRDSGKGKQAERRRQRRLYDLKVDTSDLTESEVCPESGFDTEEGGHAHRNLSKRQYQAKYKEQESFATEEAPENISRNMSEYSVRMRRIRGHPSGSYDYVDAEEINHNRKKRLVQTHAQKEKDRLAESEKKSADTKEENARYQESVKVSNQSVEDFREEIKGKVKREQLHKEQRKKESRLNFGDEDSGMVRGAGLGITKKSVSVAADAAAIYLHKKGYEAEQDNVALEGSHRAELVAENALRYAMYKTNRGIRSRKSRLRYWDSQEKNEPLFGMTQETGKRDEIKKQAIRRHWQKQRYKKAYRAAQKEKQTAEAVRITQTFLGKAKRAVAAAIGRNKGIFGVIAVLVLLFVLMATSLSSCGASMQGTMSSVTTTTYVSTDEDIYAVENAYAALENALNSQINSMETRHPGYEEYRYQVDEITHNPYHLISYFTAKYGEFTYEQVADEIEEIFNLQYRLVTENTQGIVTETKMVRVGESLGQVVTSGYCSCPICCGQWSGGPTASGVYPTANHTIAVDATNPFVPMGTKVIMNGVEYVVEDTGNFAQYGVQFDVYYSDHSAASVHGHRTWEAYLADDNGSKEVEVTSTRNVNRYDVTLTNHSLDSVLRSRMDENEEKRYDYYNITYGNRNYLFDINTLPGGTDGGFGYDIPAEALSDRKFANMIREAEKYLGYPYVWGGASPSTSFDCSGFVCWVINNCGNNWNVGRQTADGLRGYCSYVSPGEAKPGDLIFFQGTYSTPGASHVGIYVGDNMMIHCGNPIQYTNIASSYWQQHFMAFGRIH